MNHRLRLELIWKQKRSQCRWRSCQCVGNTKASHMGRETPRGSRCSIHLYFLFLPFLCYSGMLGKSWLWLNGSRCFLSWQLCIHRLYTQTWTVNATSSSFWRHSQKNAAEELRNVITHRNIYVQLLVHTENAKHNILLIAWCLRVQINTPGFSTTPRSDHQHVLIVLYSSSYSIGYGRLLTPWEKNGKDICYFFSSKFRLFSSN